jgi:hypothetical protein
MRTSIDRSLAFTALLELDPAGFGKISDPQAGQMITKLVEDFHASGAKDWYGYTREWLTQREAGAEEVQPQAQPFLPDGSPNPYQVHTTGLGPPAPVAEPQELEAGQ